MVPKLTKSGTAILLNALSGKTINFTKMQLGNGKPQDEKEALSLNNPLITVPFTKIDVSENYVALTATFNNSTVESGFRITEVGFFVEDPDDENNEVLYALGVEDSGTADFVPDNTNRVIEMEFEALIFVGEAENVTAAINSSLVYTLKEEFEGHTGDTNNPHNVTKAQVGLDKVPNVSTNDQTPTYTETKTLSELTSGEKLSILLGKLALAVKNLIAHLSNKKNPHGVTAADTGAAPVSHTHGATDINSGKLPITRGGTNATTAADARANLGAAAASHTHNASAITSGTLPVTRGGTGATTAEGARENLGAAPANHTHYADDIHGRVRFVTGSYVGNGKYGSNNERNLTFDGFSPRIIILIGEKGGRTVTLIYGNSYAVSFGKYPVQGSDVHAKSLNVRWSTDGDTWRVYWYSTESALAQFNVSGETYTYIVIGS